MKKVNRAVPGFLLIELLVALAAMSLFLLIFAQSQWHVQATQLHGKKYFEALALASSAMERCLVYRKLPEKRQQTIGDFSLQWQVHTEPLRTIPGLSQPLAFNTHQFATLTLTVRWQGMQTAKRALTLVSGFAIKMEAANA